MNQVFFPVLAFLFFSPPDTWIITRTNNCFSCICFLFFPLLLGLPTRTNSCFSCMCMWCTHPSYGVSSAIYGVVFMNLRIHEQALSCSRSASESVRSGSWPSSGMGAAQSSPVSRLFVSVVHTVFQELDKMRRPLFQVTKGGYVHLKPKQCIIRYSIFSKQLPVGNGVKPPLVTNNIWPVFYNQPADCRVV